MFEKYMEYNLGLDISRGYPTTDDFLMRNIEFLIRQGKKKTMLKYESWEPIGREVTCNDIKDNDFCNSSY